jgi:hypothetical protein
LVIEEKSILISLVVPPVFGMEDDGSPYGSPHEEIAQKPSGLGLNLGGIGKLGGSKAPVPKLDLTKAKKIQELNAKKIGEQAQPQNQQHADPKIIEKLQQYNQVIEIKVIELKASLKS